MPFARAQVVTALARGLGGVVSALALATDYFAVILVAPEALWLLLVLAAARTDVVVATAVPVATGLRPAGPRGHPAHLRRRELDRGDTARDTRQGHVQRVRLGRVGGARPGAWRSSPRRRSCSQPRCCCGARRVRFAPEACSQRGWRSPASVVPFCCRSPERTSSSTATCVPVWPALAIAAAGGPHRHDGGPSCGRSSWCAPGSAIGVAIHDDEDQHRDDWRGAAELLGTPRETRGPRGLAVL